MSDVARIKVGVLGATGFIGAPYREEIRAVQDAKILGLNARRQNLLEEAAQLDGAELISVSQDEIIQHPDINFVIIATPDVYHYDAVLACAKAGKHILCEKPVGMNVQEATEMWEVYRSQPQLTHFVPFWTRYFGIFKKLKEIVDQGILGEVRGFVYRWHNPRPANMPLTWRDDAKLSAAGSIADVGSHAYDTVCWLLRDEAVRVMAHADTITPSKADLGAINLGQAIELGAQEHSQADRRKGSTPDYASVSCQFAKGTVGTFVLSHATYFRKGLCPELELHGTEASVGINRVTGDVLLGRPDALPELIDNIPDEGVGNRFEQYVFPVLRAALDGDELPEYPNLETGWKVQQFTDAALKSAQKGVAVDLG